jgi:hypothetical protein
MYAHASVSSVTNAEWTTIHVLSDVQVMMPSTQATILTQAYISVARQPVTLVTPNERSEIFLPVWAPRKIR